MDETPTVVARQQDRAGLMTMYYMPYGKLARAMRHQKPISLPELVSTPMPSSRCYSRSTARTCISHPALRQLLVAIPPTTLARPLAAQRRSKRCELVALVATLACR